MTRCPRSLRSRKDAPGCLRYREVMRGAHVSPDMTVHEALSRWPELGAVLVRHHMACAGCAMAPFERLSEAAKAYGLSSRRLLGELRARIREGRA